MLAKNTPLKCGAAFTLDELPHKEIILMGFIVYKQGSLLLPVPRQPPAVSLPWPNTGV